MTSSGLGLQALHIFTMPVWATPKSCQNNCFENSEELPKQRSIIFGGVIEVPGTLTKLGQSIKITYNFEDMN